MKTLEDVLFFLKETKNTFKYEGVDLSNGHWLCVQNDIPLVTQFLIYQDNGGSALAYAELIKEKPFDFKRFEHFINLLEPLIPDKEEFILELEYDAAGLL